MYSPQLLRLSSDRVSAPTMTLKAGTIASKLRRDMGRHSFTDWFPGLLVRKATIVETSVAAEDFSRDNGVVYSRMEKQLTAATDSQMTDGLSTTAFLRRCAALYTCRLDGTEEDEARDE
ncbi:hypothetical protein KP79_PYT14673 [Mizuhopecten yessoensis]|uniref:Uncharacterized protein n=1 Tax=Mizuhopecten yessoensis TaxID=6573 RepID=A0A210R2Y3_MIZYE|nr:hypothetical protein KP79_PYT14673 [Mizuhopecten yessoensis]